MADLGSFIKARRKHLAMTQDELAEKCGVHKVSVWHWEKNKFKPTLPVVKTLASALRVRVEEITKFY